MHLFLAHFPVALLVAGAGAELLGVLFRHRELRRWAGWLLVLGAVGAVLAWSTGEGARQEVLARPGPPWERLEAHTRWGGAGVWALVGAGALRAAWRHHLEGPRGWILAALALLSALLVGAIANSGTAISHAT